MEWNWNKYKKGLKDEKKVGWEENGLGKKKELFLFELR